jgi:hypothetical protein
MKNLEKNNGLDIMKIHYQILKEFGTREEQQQQLNRKISALNHIRSQTTSKRILEQIDNDITYYKDKLSNVVDLDFFLLKTTFIIEEYKKELQKPVAMSFMGVPIVPDTGRKERLQQEYVKIIQQFSPQSIEQYSEITVDGCKNVHCQNKVNFHNGLCEECGLEQEIIQNDFNYRDNDRVNITSKYTYDRRIHFRDCMNQFQGKQNSTISDEVYDKLYKQIKLNGLELEGETREEKYKKITKRHISYFLKEIGFSKHYEDVHLIYHTITGKPLDDISHIEDVLLKDFDQLSELYDQIYLKDKKIERKNFINTQFVFYQLLKRHKYPCNKSDFNFLKTNERKYFHDTICSDLFCRLGWNFTTIF